MINSMTGYGEAEGEANSVCYAVEIKTLNNRYLRTIIKLPDAVAFLEEEVDKLLRKSMSRGTVNYVLRFKNMSSNVLFDIDEPALQAIVEKLGRIKSSVDINATIDVGSLLGLPGIIRPTLPDKKVAGQIRKKVLEITQEAIEKLKQMRTAEGAALEADLKKHCKAIKQDIERIRARSTTVLKGYTKKLKRRVNELLVDVKLGCDEETIAREIAIFADRSDVSEEIARLDSHLQQLLSVCQAKGQAGRRLEFIGQEMLREANTIASKSTDTEITRLVVDMKCRIDRIKEQVQNVE